MTANTEVYAPDDYQPSADGFTGRRILVTGAGQGLGRAVACAAAGLGATVVLLDRDLQALEQVYDAIEADGAPQPALYPMDLLGASPDDVNELSERLVEATSGLDALIHCAAQLGKPAPLTHYEEQSWLHTMHLNVNAPFLLTRYLLGLIAAGQAPRITYISDQCGRGGQAYMGAYSVSKWALEGLAATLAAEQPADSALRVTTFDPGRLHTQLRRQGWPAEPARELPDPATVCPELLYLVDASQTPLQGGRYSIRSED